MRAVLLACMVAGCGADTAKRVGPTDDVVDAASCGNGLVEPGEVCDDHNNTSGDGCSADCRSTEVCGNGIVDVAAGEQCDDGNLVNGDNCNSDCKLSNEPPPPTPDGGVVCPPPSQVWAGPISPTCGNGIVDPGEQCDDHNTADGDGCDHTCHIECS